MERKIVIICLFLLVLIPVFSSCNTNSVLEEDENSLVSPPGEETKDSTVTIKMKIRIGSNTFSATLLGNRSAEAFKALLPLTLTMNELNQNEKYCYLPSEVTLPTNPSNPGTIRNGDLMLYGNNCIVLFYNTFNTSYSYMGLGKLDNPSGLAEILGSGNVTVRFELE